MYPLLKTVHLLKWFVFKHAQKYLDTLKSMVGQLVLGSKANYLTKDLGFWMECPPRGLFKGFYPVFKRVSKKTTENSE